MSRIVVGTPVYDNYSVEVSHDYMRMWYHFGRRMPEHEFFFIPKTKSEQFRARNNIVTAALQLNADYLLFLDDDHVFDWQEVPGPESYDFLKKLIAHDKDIIGCLYYHRTGRYCPVLMKNTEGHKYRFLTDSEVTGGLQEVDVQGGGVMLIKMKIFDKLTPPYFEPEMTADGPSLGTDIQLCRKAKEAGFGVWCDTSIVVGHLMHERKVVHAHNREGLVAENVLRTGTWEDWLIDNWLKDYRDDCMEYTGMDGEEIIEKGIQDYPNTKKPFEDYEDKRDYYRELGIEQLCRQCYYHSRPGVIQESVHIVQSFKRGFRGRGLDFGCGSAPVGFELLRKGHEMDFVDLDGAGAYEFLKWRIKKHGLEERAGFSLGGPYDFLLFLDAIEHLQDWRSVLDDAIGRLKEKGILVTNFFNNRDFKNPEHISMDHPAVSEFLVSRNMIPRSNMFWIKDDNFMGGAMGARSNAA